MRLFPTSVDYTRAVQRPGVVFAVDKYRRAVFDVGMYGQPVPTSGQFAVVFKAAVDGSPRALRFFTQPVESSHARYAALAAHFRDHGLADLVAMCEWHDEAITVKGETWPMIDMQWVEGSILDRYVAALVRTGRAASLRQVAGVFRAAVLRLQAAQFAHGDLQPGNILIDEHGRLRLVDFDGSWAPAIADRTVPNETGHPDFQHPGRSWGRWMDTFPALVIHTSLLALARDPTLWAEFNTQNNLIFSAGDFTDPSRRVWHRLRALGDPEIDHGVQALQRWCGLAVPLEVGLADLLPADALAGPGFPAAGASGSFAAAGAAGAAGADVPWWMRTRGGDAGPAAGIPAATGSHAGPGAPPFVREPPSPWSAGGPSQPGRPEQTIVGPVGPVGPPPPGPPGGSATWAYGPGAAPGYGTLPLAPGSGPPGGGPGTRSPADRRRTRTLAIVGAAVLLVVAVLVGFALYPSGPGDGVALRAATDEMPSAIGDDYTRGGDPPAPSAVQLTDPGPSTQVAGDTPAIYAGTRGSDLCDRDALTTAVTGSSKLHAWVAALTADKDVRWPARAEQDAAVAFLRSLTPVVLRADTLVTSQRFSGGSTQAEPSVLQAGTVVLVDARGVPRVRCSGGVPLTRADVARLTENTVEGSRWAGFQVGAVKVMVPAPADVPQYQLQGVGGAAPFRRPAASTGDKDFVPAPDNAAPAGGYDLAPGTATGCTGLSDCGNDYKPTGEITVTCDAVCTATSPYWKDARSVDVQGANWKIDGAASDDYSFRCGGEIKPTTVAVSLAVRAGRVEAGTWVAERLEGSITLGSGTWKSCGSAEESWSATVSRK